jgi:hypothetical protein
MTRTTTLLATLVFATMALHAGTTLAKGGNGGNHSHSNGGNRSSMSSMKTAKTMNSSSNQTFNKQCKKDCGHQQQPPFHCGTGQPGTIVDPVHNPPFNSPVKITDPIVVNPIVRDHRGNGSQGGVTVTGGTSTFGGFNGIVRDHRTVKVTNPTLGSPTTTSGFNGIVRDHRTVTAPTLVTSGQGGVTVTNSPIVRDHRGTPGSGDSVVSTLGNGVSAVGNGLEHAAGSVAGTVGQGVSSVGHAAGSAAGAVAGTVGRGASAIGSGMADAAGAVGDFFGF